jgi:hypothetical protein
MSLIATAAMFFAKSSQDFDYATQKSEVKVFDKQLIIAKAFTLQSLSFDELFSAALSRGPQEKAPDCASDVDIRTVTATPSLNILQRWLPLNETTYYCLVINRWQLLGKGRILDIELRIQLKKSKDGKVASESLAHFRKTR